ENQDQHEEDGAGAPTGVGPGHDEEGHDDRGADAGDEGGEERVDPERGEAPAETGQMEDVGARPGLDVAHALALAWRAEDTVREAEAAVLAEGAAAEGAAQ